MLSLLSVSFQFSVKTSSEKRGKNCPLGVLWGNAAGREGWCSISVFLPLLSTVGLWFAPDSFHNVGPSTISTSTFSTHSIILSYRTSTTLTLPLPRSSSTQIYLFLNNPATTAVQFTQPHKPSPAPESAQPPHTAPSDPPPFYFLSIPTPTSV